MTLPLDVVLVRHGESEGNEAARRAREGDERLLDRLRERHSSFWRLTDRGVAQAAASGEWLRGEFPDGFDGCFSSEYTRAMETAAALALPEAEWTLHPDLRERSWGDLDRLLPHEREQRFAASLAERSTAPFYWRPPNGESMAEVSARLSSVLDALRRECPDGRAILVCHGEAIGGFRAKLEGMSQHDYQRWHADPTEKIQNGEIVHYTRRDPASGLIADWPEWRRSVVPGDEPASKDWQRIERRRYHADGLRAVVREVPRLSDG